MSDVTQRLNYFDRQFLRTADFSDEQDYHVDRRRRHNRLLHTPGVAEGLIVSGNPGDNFVTVSAGTAYDALGEEIVLAASQQVSIATITGTQALITIAYGEQFSDPSNDPGVTGMDTRVTEQPNVVAAAPPAPNGSILLASVTINAGTIDGTVTNNPNNNVRVAAGALIGNQITVNQLTLSNPAIAPTGWPNLTCSEANDLAVNNGGISCQTTPATGGAPGPSVTLTNATGGGGATVSVDFNTFPPSATGTYNPSSRIEAVDDGGYVNDIVFLINKPDNAPNSGLVERMRVTAAGSVGIGTSTPHSSVELQTAPAAQGAAGPSLTLTNTTGGAGATVSVDFNTFPPSTTGTYNPSSRIQAVDDGGYVNDVVFLTNKPDNAPNSGLVETMRVTAAGSVAPAQGAAAGPSLTLTNASGGLNASVSVDFNTFPRAATGTYNPSSRIQAVDDGGYVNDIVFLVNNPNNAPNSGLVERLRVTSDGHIKSPMWNLTQVFNQQTGPLPATGLSASFSSGGGQLLIFASGSGWSAATGQKIGMQILIDGKVQGQAACYTNESGSHKVFSANALVVAGIAMGNHTLALQTLSGTNTTTDPNDFFNVTILELPIPAPLFFVFQPPPAHF